MFEWSWVSYFSLMDNFQLLMQQVSASLAINPRLMIPFKLRIYFNKPRYTEIHVAIAQVPDPVKSYLH
jgi:hypothetical protein